MSCRNAWETWDLRSNPWSATFGHSRLIFLLWCGGLGLRAEAANQLEEAQPWHGYCILACLPLSMHTRLLLLSIALAPLHPPVLHTWKNNMEIAYFTTTAVNSIHCQLHPLHTPYCILGDRMKDTAYLPTTVNFITTIIVNAIISTSITHKPTRTLGNTISRSADTYPYHRTYLLRYPYQNMETWHTHICSYQKI